jgi:hypothetical protein
MAETAALTDDIRSLRIVWFGSYSRGPGYPRADTLIAGLRALGHEVVEVHAPLFGGAADRVDAGGGGGVVRMVWGQTVAALSLARQWFRVGDHHVAVAGNGGVVDPLLLRFLQNVERRPLIMDAFIPLYDTAVRDRELARPESLRARLLLALERMSARVSDLVLTDTAAHASLVSEDLSLPEGKAQPVPICQTDPGPPHVLPGAGPLQVLLVATYIPLHGVETVVECARLLGGDGIEITIVGTGQEYKRIASRAAEIPGLTLVPRFEDAAEISARLHAAHVGLGVFGETEKAARVVPLKAALVLSHGRALVTRTGAAADACFADRRAAIQVPPGDPTALADALRQLRDDRDELERVAAAGRALYVETFAPEAVARRLLDVLRERGLLPIT